MRRLLVPAMMCLVAAGCAPDPDTARLEATTKATYDKATGRLQLLTYDANKNGTIDTWTYMDGTRVLRSELDTNEDGRIDRWEYHDAGGTLEKVGFSRADNGKPDAWVFAGADGQVARIEVSSKADDKAIDRWEHYERGVLVRSEDDTNGDGRPDKWETHVDGAIRSASFDENSDGRPDRRLTYDASGTLVTIESQPDASGGFTKKVTVK